MRLSPLTRAAHVWKQEPIDRTQLAQQDGQSLRQQPRQQPTKAVGAATAATGTRQRTVEFRCPARSDPAVRQEMTGMIISEPYGLLLLALVSTLCSSFRSVDAGGSVARAAPDPPACDIAGYGMDDLNSLASGMAIVFAMMLATLLYHPTENWARASVLALTLAPKK